MASPVSERSFKRVKNRQLPGYGKEEIPDTARWIEIGKSLAGTLNNGLR